MAKLNLKLFAWVVRGSQRREVIRFIDGRRIPAQIYTEATKRNQKITRNSVSDVLRAFVKQGLAKCINPEETKGRIYKLTQQGGLIKKEVLKTE